MKRKSIEQLKNEGLVKNASEIEPNKSVYNNNEKSMFEFAGFTNYPIPSRLEDLKEPTGNHVGYHTTDKNTVEWIVTIEKYCELEGITPLDLILSHRERNKPIKSKKGTKTPKTEENVSNDTGGGKKDRSNWFDTYRKSKTGYNP